MTPHIDHSCPICKNREVEVLGEHPDFLNHNVLFCNTCSFMWTSPDLCESELNKMYVEQYRKIRNENPDEKYIQFMDARALAQKKFIFSHAHYGFSPKTILDIGCGAGSLLLSLAGTANSITGFEPDKRMISIARERLPTHTKLFQESFSIQRLENARYQLITTSHVFEHIPEPLLFLTDIFRGLEEDGIVFLEVPHEIKKNVQEMVDCHYKGLMHLSFFNPDTLKKMITLAGGEIVYLRTFGPAVENYSHVSLYPHKNRTILYMYKIARKIPGIRQHAERILANTTIDQDEAGTPESGIHIRLLMKKRRSVN